MRFSSNSKFLLLLTFTTFACAKTSHSKVAPKAKHSKFHLPPRYECLEKHGHDPRWSQLKQIAKTDPNCETQLCADTASDLLSENDKDAQELFGYYNPHESWKRYICSTEENI